MAKANHGKRRKVSIELKDKRMKTTSASKIIGSAAVVLLCACGVAQAECNRWDASGQWQIKQGDLVVKVDLGQTGSTLRGTAQYRRKDKDYSLHGNPAVIKRTLNGGVVGKVDGNNINLEMDWDDGSGGIYTGTIAATGMIYGKVIIDRNRPGNTWFWSSRQPMICADDKPKSKPPVGLGLPPPKTEDPSLGDALKAGSELPLGSSKRVISHKGKGSTAGDAASPAASPKRVISHKGKGPTDATAPAGVPKIVVFNKPGQAPGTQTLTWDGGPDHPYAEVWVSVDGGQERKVVEQGKGTRQVSVEPGKTYRYILTDSGQQLATDTATGK